MALEDLTPVTRTEAILDGDDISPVTRMEYFLGKAANEVPKPEGVSDAGKVLTVNETGDGFELDTPESGLPVYTSADEGKVLGLAEGTPTTQTVIPAQTVTLDGVRKEAVLSNVSITEDTTAIYLSYNYGNTNDTATLSWDDDYGSFRNNDGSIAVFDSNGEWMLYMDGLGNVAVTVSATVSVPSVEPAWVQSGGSGGLTVATVTLGETADFDYSPQEIYDNNIGFAILDTGTGYVMLHRGTVTLSGDTVSSIDWQGSTVGEVGGQGTTAALIEVTITQTAKTGNSGTSHVYAFQITQIS